MPWAAAIPVAASVIGGLIQGDSASNAANNQADALRQAAANAQFRPVGVTTNFGSSNFGFNDQNQLTSAGYNLSPQLQGIQGGLMNAAAGYNYQPNVGFINGVRENSLAGMRMAMQQAPNAFNAGNLMYAQAPNLFNKGEAAYGQGNMLFGQAANLFPQANAQFLNSQQVAGAGQGYLSQSPEAAQAAYLARSQAALAPQDEQTLARLRNQVYQKGRAGLATGGTTAGGLLASNPEMAAYYNSLAQRNLALNAQAGEQARADTALGSSLYGQSANIANVGGNLYNVGAGVTTAGGNLYNVGANQYGTAGQLTSVGNQALATGGGLLTTSTGGTTAGGLLASNPEMAAYYNSLAQRNLALNAQAGEQARADTALGSSLYGQSANIANVGGNLYNVGAGVTTAGGNLYNVGANQYGTAGQLTSVGNQALATGGGLLTTSSNLGSAAIQQELGKYQLQNAALNTLGNYLGQARTIESMGQNALDIGSTLGAQQSTAGANAGRYSTAAAAAQYPADAYNPLATAFTAAGASPSLNTWFSSIIKSNPVTNPGTFTGSNFQLPNQP